MEYSRRNKSGRLTSNTLGMSHTCFHHLPCPPGNEVWNLPLQFSLATTLFTMPNLLRVLPTQIAKFKDLNTIAEVCLGSLKPMELEGMTAESFSKLR